MTVAPPGKEILSRKNIQFAGIRLETGQQYIDEMLNKYPPGTPIKGGGPLGGDLILEVPVQNKGISKDLLEYAASKESLVIIRDVQGKILRICGNIGPCLNAFTAIKWARDPLIPRSDVAFFRQRLPKLRRVHDMS